MDAQMLTGRRVAVAVDGGPEAFEAADLVRRLVRAGAEVRVAMTPEAEDWIRALTLETVSRHPAARQPAEGTALAVWAHAAVLLSAGPGLLGALAAGVELDAPTALAATSRAPLVLVPAGRVAEGRAAGLLPVLEPRMAVLPPGSGAEAAAEAVWLAARPPDLSGRRILVTAGPTREALDPVRFLTNPSSGRMGYALADAARRRGAEVILCSGPTHLPPPEGVRLVPVVTAEDMDAAVRREAAGLDALIAVAAVADWRPAEVAPEKLKKGQDPAAESTLRLVRTPDVLARFAASVQGRPDRPVLVGFAAETERIEAHAREKLLRKHLDLVVANDVKGPSGAFGAATNEVLLVGLDAAEPVPRAGKLVVAHRILDRVAHLLSERR